MENVTSEFLILIFALVVSAICWVYNKISTRAWLYLQRKRKEMFAVLDSRPACSARRAANIAQLSAAISWMDIFVPEEQQETFKDETISLHSAVANRLRSEIDGVKFLLVLSLYRNVPSDVLVNADRKNEYMDRILQQVFDYEWLLRLHCASAHKVEALAASAADA